MNGGNHISCLIIVATSRFFLEIRRKARGVLDQKHVMVDAEQASVDFNTTPEVRWAVFNWGLLNFQFSNSAGQFGSRQAVW